MTRQLRLTAIMAIVMTMLLPFQAWAENSGITIYVKGSTAPYIHIWECDDFETTWPGIQMTESTTINGEKFWYYTVTRNSLRFIIHNNNGSQSADLSADGDRYFDENWNDITDQMTAPASHTYTVAGNAGILNGKEWDPASETNRMTSTDGVTYTLEVKNAELTAGNYEYKVCEDGSWDVMYPAGDNAILTIPADGTYDITYTYKVGDTEPSYSIKPSEGSNLVLFSAHYGLASSEEKTELMLLKGSDGKWKSTIEGLTAGNYEIVVKGTDGSSYPESPVNLNATIDNLPYEVSFDETTKDVIVNIAILNFTVVGGAGILNGVDWDPTSETNRMTSTDGVTYTLEVKNAELTAGNYEYKVCEDGNWIVTYPAGPNATLTIPANGTYDITFTYKVGDAEPSAEATPVGTGGGTETGISLVNGSTNATDRIYNLQGRQVKILTKGFYIKNNKKIIVK